MTIKSIGWRGMLIYLLINHYSILYAQVDTHFFNYWQYYSDNENALYKHFCHKAFDQLNERKAKILELKSKEDWLSRQKEVRQKLEMIAGPFPGRTPLNAKVTGKIRKEGYTIEKVLYESIPGYYVTGALYIPEGVRRKAPAVFYACGHSTEGFRVAIYQHIIINLVKKGFVVFTIDPMGQGERYEYWDVVSDSARIQVPDHEHSFAGAQCLLSGYSTAKYFIWDVIRGIDYMLTRKEVDPERIGMTGRSGGGNITAYVGALDDRVLAAAPECYITNYEYIFKSIGPQCAEQNLYMMIRQGLDHADLIEARAPKPTLIIATTRDFFSIQGARDTYAEAGQMFAALGSEGTLTMVTDDTVHRSTPKNREAMYAFFQKYLSNPGDPTDLKVAVPEPGELKVTPTGQVATSLSGETIYSMNHEITTDQWKALEEKRKDPAYLGSIPAHTVKHSGLTETDARNGAVFSGRSVKPGYAIDKYLLQGSGDYMLPAILIKPAEESVEKAILLIEARGMDHAVNDDRLVWDLVGEGHAVLVMDLPGIGSLGPGYLKGDSYIEGVSYNQWFAAVLTGGSIVGLQASDIVSAVQFLKDELPELQDIYTCSTGAAGSSLLHAAVMEPEIKKVCLIRPFLSFADISGTRFYKPEYIHYSVAGALKDYDLPDLMAYLSPRKLLIIDPVDASGKPAGGELTEKYLDFPQKVYKGDQSPLNFRIIAGNDNNTILHEIRSWARD